MRRRIVVAVVAAIVIILPVDARGEHVSGRPDCTSQVDAAPAAAMQLGAVTIQGSGGGFVGTIEIPYLEGISPRPTPIEADVVGALLNLDLIGVLGGGTTTLTETPGNILGSDPTVVTGAQVITATAFTGHLKAVPKTYECDSVVTPNTVVRYSYFDITLTGLLTPTSLGSPLSAAGLAYDVVVFPGDTNPT